MQGNAMQAELLSMAPGLRARAAQVMGPLAAARDELRARLLDTGWIIAVPEDPPEPPDSLCAVDGARLAIRMSGADLLIAGATSADGRHAVRACPDESAAWADIVPHAPELDKVAGSAMAVLELRVAARVTHQVRLLDGSFFTPVIEFRKGLGTGSRPVRDAITGLLREYRTAEDLAALLDYDPARPVLALPKSETASVYRREFDRIAGGPLVVPDRVLAGHVLRGGELLRPRPMHEWAGESICAHSDASASAHAAAAALQEAVSGFQAAIRDRTALTCYYKPRGASQVLRFEYRSAAPDDVDTAVQHARLLASETLAPHAMEPFAQWAVDRKAKDISACARALRASIVSGLDPDQARAWGRYVAEDYRT